MQAAQEVAEGKLNDPFSIGGVADWQDGTQSNMNANEVSNDVNLQFCRPISYLFLELCCTQCFGGLIFYILLVFFLLSLLLLPCIQKRLTFSICLISDKYAPRLLQIEQLKFLAMSEVTNLCIQMTM